MNLNLNLHRNPNLNLNLNMDPNLDMHLNLDLNVAKWLSSFEMLPQFKRTALAEQGRCMPGTLPPAAIAAGGAKGHMLRSWSLMISTSIGSRSPS